VRFFSFLRAESFKHAANNQNNDENKGFIFVLFGPCHHRLESGHSLWGFVEWDTDILF
jgi:predicted class III extradiol MEMO1 family dioxygenase